MVSAECRPLINVFTRLPVAGGTKTRLIPVLGEQGAASLSRAMLEWTLETLSDNWPGEICIVVAPETDGVTSSLGFNGNAQTIQRGDNLGDRMLNAIADDTYTTSECPRAIIGADVPHVPASTLQDAACRLHSGDNVIGPAIDGGFYFIGMLNASRDLFENVIWGADDVYRRVMDNADRIGMTFYQLPELRDIDTPTDLQLVAREYPPLAEFLLQAGVNVARVRNV
ncbi:MAG: hypothetical protein DHS20C01_03790 [marine bacterium B5-7]|nr:MAG: hypothetical protein DHS20C01_03790 [marine bacterium B5-7]